MELREEDKRPVALLDVDHTSTYGDMATGQINFALFDELKARGINDLYLFTDMTINEGNINDREALITVLRNQGFTVHGVITPNDFAWNLTPATLHSFKDSLFRNNTKFQLKNVTEYAQIAESVEPVLSGLPEIQELLGTTHTPPIGYAYAEGKMAHDNGTFNRHIVEKSSDAKFVFDIAGLKSGLGIGKGLLFRQFLDHKPDWCGQCLVFDDKAEEIHSIEIAVHNANNDAKVVHGFFGTLIPNLPERNTFSEKLRIADLEKVNLSAPDKDLLEECKKGLVALEYELENQRNAIEKLNYRFKFPGANPITDDERRSYQTQLDSMKGVLKKMDILNGQLKQLHDQYLPNVAKTSQILKEQPYKKVMEIIQLVNKGVELKGRDQEICQGLIEDFKRNPRALLHEGRQKDINRIHNKMTIKNSAQGVLSFITDRPKWTQRKDTQTVQNSNLEEDKSANVSRKGPK